MGKADAGTKKFWRDNERFADLFNAVIFNGESVIHPEDLTEMNTEASMALKTEKFTSKAGVLGSAQDLSGKNRRTERRYGAKRGGRTHRHSDRLKDTHQYGKKKKEG